MEYSAGGLPPEKTKHPHVTIDPLVLDGSPVVTGTRLPVRRLWQWHRKGVTVQTLVQRYPSLGWARVLCALAWCHDNREVVEADLDRERAIMGA